jgi:hypothetical protein
MFATRAASWQLGAAACALGSGAAYQWTAADPAAAGAAACEAAPPPPAPAAPRVVPLHAPRATAVSLAELRRWLEQRGADLSGVEIRRAGADGGRFGVFATPEAQRRAALGWWGRGRSWVGLGGGSATLASFPLATAITAAAVTAPPAGAPGGQRGRSALTELLELGVVDERTVVQLYLAVERARGEASPMRPWMALLPAAFATPLYWTEGELGWLRGTALHKATT